MFLQTFCIVIKSISEKLKDRTNNRQTYTQEQDANERQVIYLKQEYKEAFSEVNEIIKMQPPFDSIILFTF